MSEDKKNWSPTPQQRAFVEDVVATNGENVSESYRKAYPNAANKYAGVESYRLMRNKHIKGLIEQIQQDMRAKFILLAPVAMDRLEELAENADNERVKLDANLQILDRAGLRPPEKVEISGLGVFGSVDPEDIKKQIREKQEAIIRVKDALKKQEEVVN